MHGCVVCAAGSLTSQERQRALPSEPMADPLAGTAPSSPALCAGNKEVGCGAGEADLRVRRRSKWQLTSRPAACGPCDGLDEVQHHREMAAGWLDGTSVEDVRDK